MTEAVHQTILLVDIEGSGLRDDVEKPVIRSTMYEAVLAALTAAQAEPGQYRMADRGDGAMVLLDPSIAKRRILSAVLHELPIHLAASNRLASAGTQVRLRAVVHAGEVQTDARGEVGRELDAAFRMLDAAPLREALRTTSGPLALGVSEAIHQSTVRHDYPGVPQTAFQRTEFEAKEGVLPLWVHTPGGPPLNAAATEHRTPSSAPVAPTTSGHVLNAGTVHGDQFIGDKFVHGNG